MVSSIKGVPVVGRMLLLRFLRGLATLFVISLVIFIALEVLPGSYARNVLGQGATPETVANLEHRLGLDQPAWWRYLRWIGGAMEGDLGTSYSGSGAGRSVSEIIAPRLRNTFFLAALAAVFAVPLALGGGVIAVLYRHRLPDRIFSGASLSLAAVPEYIVGYAVMFLLAVKLGWQKPLSNVSTNPAFGELFSAALLPALTLALVIIAHMFRMTRTALIQALGETYIETARLKGLSERQVILDHALPNCWAPIGAVIAFNLAYLVVGAVVVEAVFAYPGIGRLLVDSVSSLNMPVVQACVLIFAAAYIILNLSAELLGILTNPRLLHPK